MSYDPQDDFNGVSDCCNAPLIDPGNVGEGFCSDCKDHASAAVEESDLTFAPERYGAVYGGAQ